MRVYRILPCRQVLEYNFYRVAHLGLYHGTHDSQMFFVIGSTFLFGKCGVSELTVNCLFVPTADKMGTWNRVTRGNPVEDGKKIQL